ncbi:MAG: hypothetical protein NVSMB2_07710 [Chloroflexota bacterium]
MRSALEGVLELLAGAVQQCGRRGNLHVHGPVPLEDVRILTRARRAGSGEWTIQATRIVLSLGKCALSQTQVDIAQKGLRDQRAQGGINTAANARWTQDIRRTDVHIGIADAAAIRLTLAHIVPIVMRRNALASGWQDHDLHLRNVGERG